jgi:hypothetical protein
MISRISSFAGPISSTPKPRIAYRYYRFNTTKIKDKTADGAGNPEGLIQISEFQLQYAGTRIDYTGATATNPGGTNPAGEEAPKGIDNNTATKWLDSSNRSVRSLVVDFVTPKIADSFKFATANDTEGRDPIQWTVDGSNDSNNWTTLHSQTTDASITASRNTYTQVFYFTK